ncbi:MAG: hypothetical protein LKI39_02560 [Bacteroides sp.]|jgi:hypothetical protein|nr:hypothetical protein [Bacteroides sp.]
MDLFGNEDRQARNYRRDSYGRFASEKDAKYEKALREAAKYKQMYSEMASRVRGMVDILRMKDELILKLRSK